MKNKTSNAAETLDELRPKTVSVCARRCSTEVLAFRPIEKKQKNLPPWIESDPNYHNMRSFMNQIVAQLEEQISRLIPAINRRDRDDIDACASTLCELSESVNASRIMRESIRVKLASQTTTFSEIECLAEAVIEEVDRYKASIS